ncbi:MAG: respiratory nitrate reductase subunit gamma [Elusimicrobia bacterium]|nr:respiratory nitrate reductase subunit gamma [Elusimicrobiota bacterium]
MQKEILYIALPYAALVLGAAAAVYSYAKREFTFSSLSSQFLEGRALFWGVQPFHWGALVLLSGHFLCIFFPSAVLAWNAVPARLFAFELASFTAGVLMLSGLLILLARRLVSAKIRAVTTPMDYVVLLVLISQVTLGLLTAALYRWGSSWFAAVLSPYLLSLFKLAPSIGGIANMKGIIQAHVVMAFVVAALIPFSRLAHLLVFPLPYLWRPTQVVIWNRDRLALRDPEAENAAVKPLNC